MDRPSNDGNGQGDGTARHHDGRASAVGRLRLAIDAAATGGAAHAELDAAAKALVTELRRANEPPEQVLVAIKELLAEAGLRPSHGSVSPPITVDPGAHLYRSVVETTIRHYFAHQDHDGQSES